MKKVAMAALCIIAMRDGQAGLVKTQ
jgi:hypothetical protein